MTEQAKTTLYEVGTFEQYEEGFHAFYRTLNKEKALKVLEVAKDCHSRLPKWDLEDDSFSAFSDASVRIDYELKEVMRNGFNISSYQGVLYTIEMREVTLDD